MNAYRVLFALAALYNVVFAAWSGLFPRAFFASVLGMPPPRWPVAWPAVAAFVALCGLLYAYAAWRPERGDLAVALGLLTKLAGPAGWLAAVGLGHWPASTFPLVLLGDMVWWFPLLSYLLRRSPRRPLYVIGLNVAVHAAACLGLLAIAPATELAELLDPNGAREQQRIWVQQHLALWTAVWFAWSAASLSLFALCNAWTNCLGQRREIRIAALAGCMVVGCGVILDLGGNATQVVWATRPELDAAGFALAVSWYQSLSPSAANTLYCLGGMLLSLLSWQVNLLRGAAGLLGITMWTVGLSLSVATFLRSPLGMSLSGAALMLLYLPWAMLLAVRLTRDSPPPPSIQWVSESNREANA